MFKSKYTFWIIIYRQILETWKLSPLKYTYNLQEFHENITYQ